MPIDFKESVGFIYLGTSPQTNRENYSIAVPYPTKGKAPFATSRLVDSGRNAQGAMVGRMIGRSLDKQSMSWEVISCAKWWEMNRWFEDNHFTFYCHYFNFNTGRWLTRLMYISDVTVSPELIESSTGEPAFLRDASVNVIDCGVI